MSKKGLFLPLLLASVFSKDYERWQISYNDEPAFKQAFNKHRKNVKKGRHK